MVSILGAEMSTTQLSSTINFLTEQEVVSKAAAVSGLIIRGNKSHKWLTTDIASFEISAILPEALKETGFTLKPGTKPPYDSMMYLSGNSEQEGADIWESDSWAFEKDEKHPLLTISFALSVKESDGGVAATPEVWGNCKGGACHFPTIKKLVHLLASQFPNTHPFLDRIASEGDYPVIKWGEIGLEGLRSLGELFREQYGHSNLILHSLAPSYFSPFEPNPRKQSYGDEVRYFVPADLQHELTSQWKAQLADFRDKLQ